MGSTDPFCRGKGYPCAIFVPRSITPPPPTRPTRPCGDDRQRHPVPDCRPLAETPLPPDRVTDEALVAAVRDGDEEALALLYDRYAAPIYALALRIMGDRGAAQEVTQDTFLKLWRNAHTFDPARGVLAAWLFAIARRCALDVLRSRRRRPPIVEGRFISDGGTLPEPSTSDASEQVVLAQVVAQALAHLPRAQRQAIELAYFGGLTQQEIATQIDAPLGTVKSRMRAGMEGLRLRLTARQPTARSEEGSTR
jgi:RNA polymerase sigma-70 factor, ECF subfamily